MQLKVTPKDLIIFSIFCVVLLYFCSVAVPNVLIFFNEGTFSGLNPLIGFKSQYIFGTLFLFFAILTVIFLSVSSTIFDHSKGFGISVKEKEEKGYSRWCKEKEMKKAYKIYKVGVKDETAEAGGVVFINDGKQMWVDNSENHTLVIGVTGSGKTTAVVDPLIYSLCKHGESMVITDPKGEIYKNHAELLRARGYNIVVLNFRQPSMGNAWNPLTLPYRLYKAGNIDKAVELVDDVALNILQDKKANDPFWEKSASDYFSGCALGLLEDAKEEQVNLNTISYMTTVGEEKFGAGSTYIKEYFNLKGESSSAYVFASNTINSPTETKGGILSVFRQKIRLFASREQLSEMLAYSDFDMRNIGKEKTAVFMVIHDEKRTYHALATIFIKQCYETLIDVAQECGGSLPFRTNFILDEFANMPPLKDVTTMVTAARSRAIRFTFIIQNFAQLNEVYGKEDAETIRSNCGNLMYLLTTELAALEEISKLCGEVKSKKDDKTASQPLVTVSDLQKLKMNEVIILRNRMHPFRTKLKQGFDTDWGDSEFGKAEFFHREPKEIQLFDIKEFVKLRKQSKMMDNLNNNKMPIGGGMGFNDLPPSPNMPKIPTFEEFMAARNGNADPKASMPKDNKPIGPSFDVDDLVKRIDAKIAELEAQEKAEEEAKKKEEATSASPEASTKPSDVQESKPVVEKEIPNISAEPVEVGLNPFNKPKTEEIPASDFIDKIEEDTPTNPVANIMAEPHVQTFEELMQQNRVETPNEKPQLFVPNIEGTEPTKPLTGIVNPLTESFSSNAPSTPNPQSTNPVPASSAPENPNIINTLPSNNKTEPIVKVDTDSKVMPQVSDDAFFDDFFDED